MYINVSRWMSRTRLNNTRVMCHDINVPRAPTNVTNNEGSCPYTIGHEHSWMSHRCHENSWITHVWCVTISMCHEAPTNVTNNKGSHLYTIGPTSFHRAYTLEGISLTLLPHFTPSLYSLTLLPHFTPLLYSWGYDPSFIESKWDVYPQGYKPPPRRCNPSFVKSEWGVHPEGCKRRGLLLSSSTKVEGTLTDLLNTWVKMSFTHAHTHMHTHIHAHSHRGCKRRGLSLSLPTKVKGILTHQLNTWVNMPYAHEWVQIQYLLILVHGLNKNTFRHKMRIFTHLWA